mmetsp:Transcript_29114/g.48950  ORF Transcript_29114/g.48950 Transcript_29114/m.48950 type:complete len:175 (-) Transcript_29114:942-1466(-)
MNQSLVDDNLVVSDKIGSANFFWSFPSKAYQDQIVRRQNLERVKNEYETSKVQLEERICEARTDRCGGDRAQKLQRLALLREEEFNCDTQLDQLKVNDPEEILKVERIALNINKAAADRWTDNVWTIKSYLTKRKGLSGKEVDRMLRIDSSFDYAEFQPPRSSSATTNKRKSFN